VRADPSCSAGVSRLGPSSMRSRQPGGFVMVSRRPGSWPHHTRRVPRTPPISERCRVWAEPASCAAIRDGFGRDVGLSLDNIDGDPVTATFCGGTQELTGVPADLPVRHRRAS